MWQRIRKAFFCSRGVHRLIEGHYSTGKAIYGYHSCKDCPHAHEWKVKVQR